VTSIERYLRRISRLVESFPNIEVEFYTEQILSTTRANLRFKLRGPSGAILEVSEAIEWNHSGMGWLSYSYHFQNADTILRYDNSPHHPELSHHPEHRHRGMAVESGRRPDLEEFFREIRELIQL